MPRGTFHILRLLLIFAFTTANPAFAETVAIIGTGNVGMAIGTEMAGLGHTVIYGSRSPASSKTLDLVAKSGEASSAALPAEAAGQADVIVLAVPGMLVAEVSAGLGELSGKIIIDATNPLLPIGEGPRFAYGVDSSNGQIVQEMHPDAQVVKAFNTTFAGTLVAEKVAGQPLDVFLSERTGVSAARLGLPREGPWQGLVAGGPIPRR